MTFKDGGSLKARLVVQGFTDQRLGKIPTSSRTASRRSRQICLTLAVSLGFQTHKGYVKCAFLQADLDEHLKLETGDLQDLKYGVYRIIGSGATVQSVSRCLLVVKTAIPLFHDGMKKLQRWNHLHSD